MVNRDAVKELLDACVSEASVQRVGSYTSPRTWGVYEIDVPAAGASRRYRLGNHPVRERELAAEFGKVKRIALFISRAQAEDLERLLNGRN